MLVELGLVEQRYRAVSEVFDGASVTDVARRYGVSRQTVHGWLRRYARNGGLGGLADRSSRPDSCPHQMPAEVEAQVIAMRRAHSAWGPATILFHLERAGVDPLPGRSSIYRALRRHGLVTGRPRRRRREDYQRWERARSMELWQMDVMGRVFLSNGRELKLVTGIDDHSRFVVCARVVERATARAVCDALMFALSSHGVPEQLLTDNGSVFTHRFSPGPGPVMFDQICTQHGIKHLLTAPFSPTTTGKIERFHKTVRGEFLTEHDRQHATIAELQAAVDSWVAEYNTDRPHQSCGRRPPVERFALADPMTVVDADPAAAAKRMTRWADPRGRISVRGIRYVVGPTFANELVDITDADGLIQVFHHGVLVATRAQQRRTTKLRNEPKTTVAAGPPLPPTTGPTVSRLVDGKGEIGFAAKNYSVGKQWAGRRVDVSIVENTVQFAIDGTVVRIQPIRHDRTKEHGAFARPNGIARKRPRQDDHVNHLPDPIRRARTGT